jgi:hypothetical protein
MGEEKEKLSLKARVENSRRRRAEIVGKHGMVPLSLLTLPTQGKKGTRPLYNFQRETPARRGGALANEGEDRGKTLTPDMAERKTRIQSGISLARGTSNVTGLSIMPSRIVEFFVRYYAKPGDAYVDPFMGQGVQMQVAKLRGLDYYGYDLSAEFFAFIDAVREKIDDGETVLSATLGDSRKMDAIPDGIGDFCFTSPPYWDIEWYGSEPEQLGTGQTYQGFLGGMEEVATELLRKMKPGGIAVVNVGDLRRKGRFYPYGADTVALFCRAGWEPWDTWILANNVAATPRMFAVQRYEFKIAPKVHEYAYVFRRPKA